MNSDDAKTVRQTALSREMAELVRAHEAAGQATPIPGPLLLRAVERQGTSILAAIEAAAEQSRPEWVLPAALGAVLGADLVLIVLAIMGRL